LKVTLENNAQLLEQTLEDMRATYQLNTEKLDYNFRVLTQRDKENKQAIDHLTMKLRRLKEQLGIHAHRYKQQDEKFKQENVELTEEYKRITESFKDLQKKLAHFELIDRNKYAQVFEMNEDSVMALVKKLLKANELIHEQVLGLKYISPFSDPSLSSVLSNNKSRVDTDSLTSTQIVLSLPDTNDMTKRDGLLNRLLVEHSSLATTSLSTSSSAPSDTSNSSKHTQQQIKNVMDLLVAHTGYLIDSRVREATQTLDEEEAKLYKVDAILSSLGVEDLEDL